MLVGAGSPAAGPWTPRGPPCHPAQPRSPTNPRCCGVRRPTSAPPPASAPTWRGSSASWGCGFTDYAQLWEWSVTDLDAFWGSIWDHFGVQAASPPERVLGNADGSGRGMPGARWFPGSRVNYAAQALVPAGVDDGAVAVVAHSQSRERVELTWAELRAEVARAAAGLRRARRGARRPGGGLPPQHPRDARRVPRHRQPRRGVVVVRARVRHAQRRRPLRADRADRAARRRRLPLRQPCHRPPRRGRRHPRRAADR